MNHNLFYEYNLHSTETRDNIQQWLTYEAWLEKELIKSRNEGNKPIDEAVKELTCQVLLIISDVELFKKKWNGLFQNL